MIHHTGRVVLLGLILAWVVGWFARIVVVRWPVSEAMVTFASMAALLIIVRWLVGRQD
jgi:hypothetical protein